MANLPCMVGWTPNTNTCRRTVTNTKRQTVGEVWEDRSCNNTSLAVRLEHRSETTEELGLCGKDFTCFTQFHLLPAGEVVRCHQGSHPTSCGRCGLHLVVIFFSGLELGRMSDPCGVCDGQIPVRYARIADQLEPRDEFNRERHPTSQQHQ